MDTPRPRASDVTLERLRPLAAARDHDPGGDGVRADAVASVRRRPSSPGHLDS